MVASDAYAAVDAASARLCNFEVTFDESEMMDDASNILCMRKKWNMDSTVDFVPYHYDFGDNMAHYREERPVTESADDEPPVQSEQSVDHPLY